MAATFTYLSISLAFLVVFISLRPWITIANKLKFKGIDLNKYGKPKIAETGGICVVLGFIIGCFAYIGSLVFIYKIDYANILFLFAGVTTILLAGTIGFVDDILGWRTGIRKSVKVLLTFLVPLPIMVVNAGSSMMTLPFIGEVNFGILFPLILVPIAIIGTTNGFNMLAGYNGLEAGLGIIIVSSLGILSHLQGKIYLAGLCAVMLASLLAFFYYNKYPSKVFPGDTLTYSVGAFIGVISILANIEKFALILFIPYFFELLLKSRTVFQKASWANSSKNGKLKNKYGKWYGLPNVAISLLRKLKASAYEKEVVALVWCFELCFVAISFLSYFNFIPL